VQAVASAVIYGGCYPKGSKLEAESRIYAKTIIDTWNKVKC
jgi:hypothetical protein